jgi:serine/threonine protein kinase
MGAAQSNVLYTNDTIIINNITYTVLKKSGEGSYGKVYSVKRNSDGMKFIVKIIVNDYYGKNELDIMKFLSYYPKCAPYIVCLQDYEIAKDYIYLLMEYEKGSDMSDYLYNYEKTASAHDIPFYKDFDTFDKWFRQAIKGLCYMHKLGIIHRDIKPNNILIDINKNLKFIDFGISVLFKKGDFVNSSAGTECFTEPYLKSACFYTDIYALGITFTLILNPYIYDKELCDMFIISKAIDSIQFPEKYKYYKMLLHEMTKIRENRPSAQEILDYINSNGANPLVIEDYKKCLDDTKDVELEILSEITGIKLKKKIEKKIEKKIKKIEKKNEKKKIK